MAEQAPQREGRYPRIADHGVIGDLSTVALVCLDGAIDFFCFPDFDSPSCFAALLDAEKGGAWRLGPERPAARAAQIYLPETNVLLTRHLSRDGILEVTDFMPVRGPDAPSRVVRIVKAVRGGCDVLMDCAPAFDYARAAATATLGEDGRRAALSGGRVGFGLAATRALEVEDGRALARFRLEEGEAEAFQLSCADEDAEPITLDDALALQAEAEAFWRNWVGQCAYKGRWRELVSRSVLALKLMVSERHGSLIAAATFSLPEEIGGPRNWDYRFCWVRDAAFTIYAMIRLGFYEEARAFTLWITHRAEECSSQEGRAGLELAYRTDGSRPYDETELDHLEGYQGSRPVRIGNAAIDQLQLDIYGELLDAIYLTDKHTHKLSAGTWGSVRRLVDHVCENWERPDAGIWEFRGGEAHLLHSRVMCWVAVDRALRMALKQSFPAPVERWRETRDAIWEDVHQNFWNAEIESFTQTRGGDKVDAALLLMPLVKFISPVDPRWLSTLDRISEKLSSDVLVHRYEHGAELDGFPNSQEGAFTICSFWYVECLARAGRTAQARLYFEKLASYANHLGLYSEELGLDGAQLGNFPQAFTHLALISAAFALNEALEGEEQGTF